MKIIITGGSGLLGQYLNLFLSKKHLILTLYNSNLGNCNLFNSRKIDLKNESDLNNLFFEFKPEIIIHTAAITSTLFDGRYSLNDFYQSNVSVTENIAKVSSKLNSRMIFISTDLVYDGNRSSYLTENSKLNPLSPYAESKLIGEEKVKEFSDNYLILRLALLIGFGLNHSICHFQSMYENLINNRPVKLFTDQFRSPISLTEASRVLEEVIDLNIPTGIYNLGGNERISRFNLGLLLADILKVNKDLLIPVSLDEEPKLSKVKDVSLNNSKLSNFGIKVNSLERTIYNLLTFIK